jgi:CysZ protein
LQVAVVVALSAGAWLVFVPIAGLVTGPFAERLSEHLEAELTGAPSAAFSLGEFLHGLALALAHGLRRLLAMVAGLVVVFAIGLAPVVGTIAAPLAAVWFAAVAAAYDCYDSVLARRMLSYRDKLGYLADHRARTLGLGAAVATMLLVPGLNLIALGLGTAGATVAAHELAAARPHRALR